MTYRITLKGYESGRGWQSETAEADSMTAAWALAHEKAKRFVVVKVIGSFIRSATIDTTAEEIGNEGRAA